MFGLGGCGGEVFLVDTNRELTSKILDLRKAHNRRDSYNIKLNRMYKRARIIKPSVYYQRLFSLQIFLTEGGEAATKISIKHLE